MYLDIIHVRSEKSTSINETKKGLELHLSIKKISSKEVQKMYFTETDSVGRFGTEQNLFTSSESANTESRKIANAGEMETLTNVHEKKYTTHAYSKVRYPDLQQFVAVHNIFCTYHYISQNTAFPDDMIYLVQKLHRYVEVIWNGGRI
jgi:hypothetical protein